MYEDTVTVFNYVEDKKQGTALWYPTVLDGVELQITKGTNISKSGNVSADTASIHIKINDDIRKTYKKPMEFKVLEDKQGYFTLKPDDFIASGAYRGDVVDDSDYPNGFFEHMKSTHDDVFNITTVDVFKAIPHFEVGGK